MIVRSKPSVPLATHVDKAFKSYRKGIPVFAAICFAALFAINIFISGIRTDSQILHAINAHVSSLIETQDRPELQRLLNSIAQEKAGTVLVVEDGVVFSSSGSLKDLDRPYQMPAAVRIWADSYLSSEGLMTSIPVQRINGPKYLNAKIVMHSPLYSLVIWALFIALLILCIGLLIGDKLAQQLRQVVSLALKPVEDLDEAIRSLGDLKDPDTLKPTGVDELEGIREAIVQTHEALVNARDALAEKKAKALAADAYRLLIHDLHNPVAALGGLIRIANSNERDALTREEAAKKMPPLAEQILNQIGAAKSNIDFATEILREEDVRSCVEEATEQAALANGRKNIQLEKFIPSEAIIVPHDARLLRRAIGNLVKNALEACDSKVRVVIQGLAKEISIQVMDDGPGLTQSQAGLFLQGREKSSKGNRQAFGLAAANHIVRAHGGKIIYRPSEFGGACFEVRI